ncbi:MAG: type IV pilin [Methanocorpusculum sp.]|nr:type IV pilin [Methanocorpusculum sp.]
MKDNAVSPAVGTILLVAMTVVFVAVVAVVATGLTGGLFDMKQVGLTLEPYGIASASERGISLTIHGGANAGDLVSLSASLNGPELVYRETGASYVENPQVGPDYRFKAVESNVIVPAMRGNSIHVDLETTEILPVSATEYYVTVTGTFRDGTEQVLLIQKVTLPAIPKSGSASDGEYVSVSPYSISDNYPGHGFIITVLEPEKYTLDRTTAKFAITSPSQSLLMIDNGLTRNNFGDDDFTKASYDISTIAGGSQSGWDSTPYPDLSTHWALGELTGDVTVTVKNKSDTTQKTDVTVSGIVIPKRVNIFENKSKYDGTITYNATTKTLSYESIVGSASPTYYLLPSKTKITSENQFSDHPTDNIVEAYVKETNVGGSNTHVWYRVASASVSSLLSQQSP